MDFYDYYEALKDIIDPSLSREGNLRRLREAHELWRHRADQKSLSKLSFIDGAIDVFGNSKEYEKFRKWWEDRQAKKAEVSPEDEFRKIAAGASVDKIITPTEYRMLLEEAKRLKISRERADVIIQGVAKEYGATIGEVETQPLGVPVLEVDCDHMYFENIRIGTSQSKSFTISNVGGGAMRGKISVSQPWISVSPDRIDPTKHKQQVVVTVNTTVLMPGFMSTGVINVNTNGGDYQIPVKKLSTEGYESALGWFEKELAVAFAFGGGALGSLFGRIGVGGATIFYLALLAALCYLSFSKWSHFWEETYDEGGPIAVLIVISILIGSLYGLAVLCGSVPIVGGIVCGVIASALFAPIFSERLFDYQCSNQAISPASSGIIDFKRDIVSSTATVAGILMFLAICAAISLIVFIVVVIIIVAIIIIQRSGIKEKYRL
ncbi:MAG: hypothetical protein QMD80_08170 [archaeon]|nr:hypothetical protein [archaeon]